VVIAIMLWDLSSETKSRYAMKRDGCLRVAVPPFSSGGLSLFIETASQSLGHNGWRADCRQHRNSG
jgi:hypothetical protein